MKIAALYVGSSLPAPLRAAEREINARHRLGLRIAAHNCTLPLEDAQWENVEADLAEASERGITAVPTFVFDPDGAEGGFALPGAQDPQLFARVLSKMAGGVGPPS